MTEDLSLTGTPDAPPMEGDPTAFVKPKAFTVDEVLASARRVERTASICLRADLQGEWDELADELATLVTPSGELLANDSDESMAGDSPRARVEQITARMGALRREMAANMWHVRFRGMPSDEWAPFLKKNRPKNDGADMTEFVNLLIAETAIEPTLTVEQVRELRKVFTSKSMGELSSTAWTACTEGGLDVPKLPLSLRKIAGESFGS